VFPWTAAANGSATTKLTRRTDLTVTGDVSYSPYFTYGTPGTAGNPVQPLSPGVGSAATEAPTLASSGTASLAYNMSRRATMSANANYFHSRLLDDREGDVRSYGGGGLFRYQINRLLSAHAGYTRQVSLSANPDTPNLISDYFDVGLDFGYSKGFAIARRTTAFFSTSSGVAHDGQNARFRLEGSAGLTQGLGRSWTATAFYQRTSGILAGYEGIVFSDSANGSLSGQVAPRVSFNASTNWTRGEVGFDGGVFNSYSSTASLTYAVFSRLGLYLSYSYFAYDDPTGVAIVEVAPSLSRQSLSAGLTVWQPIIKPTRERTPR
jgi:hypothetical protein